jgi:hypothetical protein
MKRNSEGFGSTDSLTTLDERGSSQQEAGGMGFGSTSSDPSGERPVPTRRGIPGSRQSALSRSAPSLRQVWGQRRVSVDGPIILGVCAMEKKARSGPMMEILNRISAMTTDGMPEFRVVFFPEETILQQPVDEWPLCEALIAFYSSGFPLRKAQAYASLRRPHVFNDLEKQELLFDRRRV